MEKTNTNQPITDPVPKTTVPRSAPNENNKIIVQGHVKIHDPNSKQVYFEGRA